MSMFKQLLAGALVLLATQAPALITQKTNSVNLVLSNVCDGTFSDFKFQLSGYDDQNFRFNFDQSLSGVACTFRITKPIEGTIYLDIASPQITVSGTSVTFSIAYSNIPPAGTYYGELLTYESVSTNYKRSVAQGKLPVTWSLYLNETNYFTVSKTNAQTGQVYIHPSWQDPPWLSTNEALGSIYATLVKHTALSGWADVIYGHVTNIQNNTNLWIAAAANATSWTNNALYNNNGVNLTNVAETLWSASSNSVISNSTLGAEAHGWGNHASAGYLSANTTLFSTIYVGNRGLLGTNMSGLQAGQYTGVVNATVAFTGITTLAVGRMYAMGFDKVGTLGTATLAIASQTLTKTAVGATSNYFVMAGTDSNLILTLYGTDSALCYVTNVWVKEMTQGVASVASDLNVGRYIYMGSTNGIEFSDGAKLDSYYIGRWNLAYTNSVSATGVLALQASTNATFQTNLNNQANSNASFSASIASNSAATNDLNTRVTANTTGKVDRVGDTNYLSLSAAGWITVPPSSLSNSPVTRKELNDAVDSLSELVLYGSTNPHPVSTLAGSLWKEVPENAWTNTTGCTDGSNYVGIYWYTNSTERIRHGEYIGRFYAKKTAGAKTVKGRIQLVYAVTDFTTTNLISTSADGESIGTDLTSYRLNVNNPSSITNAVLYLGVKYWLVQSGLGSDATIATYGGDPYNTHLATPGVGDVTGYVTSETDPIWSADPLAWDDGAAVTNVAHTNLSGLNSDTNYQHLSQTIINDGPWMTNATLISIGKGASTFNNEIAIGASAHATGIASVAIGNSCTADTSCVSIGDESWSYSASLASGFGAYARPSAVALGYQSFASNQAVAVGRDSYALADSVAIGYQVSNTVADTTMLKGDLNLNTRDVTNGRAGYFSTDLRLSNSVVLTNEALWIAASNNYVTGVVISASSADGNSMENSRVALTWNTNAAADSTVAKYSCSSTTAPGQVYYWTNGNWLIAVATNEAMCNRLIGLAISNDAGTHGIMLYGNLEVTNFPLEPGAAVFLTATNGVWGQSPPATSGQIIRSLGHAIATNVIRVNPDAIWVEVD